MNVLLHPARARTHDGHRAYDLLAASAAKCLSRLHSVPAPIAEHDAPPSNPSRPRARITKQLQQRIRRKNSSSSRFVVTSSGPVLSARVACKKRPHKRRGHPATGRPLLSRENSSNGGKAVKTFWRNLMSLKTGVSSDFCEINAFVFNGLQNQSILLVGVPN